MLGRSKPLSPPSSIGRQGRARMDFTNERTWLSAVESGTQEEFHSRYETAVYKVREQFGETHPVHIGDRALRSRATFEDRSPGDLRVLLGRFEAGTADHPKRAIAAAQAAFPGWANADDMARGRVML